LEERCQVLVLHWEKELRWVWELVHGSAPLVQ
jgi:hypothetical protein